MMIIPEEKKSYGVSMILTVLFGPIGLMYTNVVLAVALILVLVFAAVAMAPLGVIFALIAWPVCVIMGIMGVSSHNHRVMRTQIMIERIVTSPAQSHGTR